ncbi:MAG: DUF2950 domain-containing protein [Planctomycetes bacterium]|nr:DUF2950 domain-containing protein [Planctomycetota bacterium]
MLNSLLRSPTSAVLLAFTLVAGSACKSVSTAGFDTPEAALRELADTIGGQDEARAERLFGPGGPELLRSGDEVADTEDALRVQEYIREKVAFEERGEDTRIALLGNAGWSFPIPLVRESGAWRFDVESGVEEIANRRVGRNELSTIASLHAYVDAQREYASEPRDGQPRAFARTIFSSPGKHDGLYWPVAEGESESPLGPPIAEAARAGYTHATGGPQPYHGYYFRVLLEQGRNAAGGARSFLDAQGRMTGGFALLAWPAKHGSSGVMSFLVNQQGLVYERDFGPETEQAVERIRAFDPDANWAPAGG